MAPSPEINSENDNHLKEGMHGAMDIIMELSLKKGVKCVKKIEAKEDVVLYNPQKPFVLRREEAAAVRKQYPTKIPIIVERFHKETSLPCLDKSKFLVPQEITMSQFVTIIRNRLKLGPNQAFYLLVNNRSMISLSKTLIEVYSEHKEEDGFLYVTYASQEVFG